MAAAICERLRFSNASRERIEWLVRNHLKPRDAPQMRRSTLRRLLAQPHLLDLLAVARADALGGSGDVSHVEFLRAARDEFGHDLPAPLVSGNDVHEAGLQPGPAFKRMLEKLRDEQLEGRLATREDALGRLRVLVDSWSRNAPDPGGEVR